MTLLVLTEAVTAVIYKAFEKHTNRLRSGSEAWHTDAPLHCQPCVKRSNRVAILVIAATSQTCQKNTAAPINGYEKKEGGS